MRSQHLRTFKCESILTTFLPLCTHGMGARNHCSRTNEDQTCRPRAQKHELIISPLFSPRCRREGAVMMETRPQPRALAEHQPRFVVLVRHTGHRPLQRRCRSERTEEQSCTSTHRSGRQRKRKRPQDDRRKTHQSVYVCGARS